jgi:cell division protease FtsH
LNKLIKNAGFYLLIIVIALTAINRFDRQEVAKKELDYSTFLQKVEKGDVREVTIIGEKQISGVLKDGTEFTSYNPGDQDIYRTLKENNVRIVGEPPPQPPWWMTMLSSAFPILLLVGVWIFMMQQMQGGGSRVMSFGKSRAKLHTSDKQRVTFADVAGVDEAKEELKEVVDFLKNPKQFLELGARIPKGVLLFGPPGTGKTLLARAVAGEAGVPFFSISGSDFVEMFVGVGASRVRDLFENAKKNAPCIVFVDEIDAVGRQRGAGLGGGHDEREQTLNQLLVEMDGFGVNEGIILIAATNRPDVLDPALLRPGRFDRQVVVDRPDVKGRKEILMVHTKGKPLSDDVDLDVLARRTPGFTGADLSNLVNEGAILAARKRQKKISMELLEAAIDRVIAGPERKSRMISEKEKSIVAYHEGGHALVAKMLPNTDPVHKVSVIPRGGALGYVLQLPTEDRYLVTKAELLDQITVMLGGRVAEHLIFHEVSSGAQNDLERATNTARKMIMEYGMSEELGPVVLGHKQDQVFLGRDISRDRNYSEEIARKIDQEVRKIIEECFERAKTILIENREKLELVAQTLIKKEIIEGEELEELLNGDTEAAKEIVQELNDKMDAVDKE